MYRSDETRIQNWLDSSHKALLIHGAHQVGKTWLVREMLGHNQIPFYEINLLERPDILHQINSIARNHTNQMGNQGTTATDGWDVIAN